MGLGITLWAEPKDNQSLEETLAELFDELVKAAVSHDPLLASQVRRHQGESGVWLALHPAEEPLTVEIEEGKLLFSARTSGAGPGYHAFVVDLLDRASIAVGLRWLDGDPEQDDFGDETRYFSSRNFESLQREMCVWLAALTKVVLNEKDGGWSLNADQIYSNHNHFALTPRGPLSREWFERVDAAAGQQIHPLAAEYFPWWNKGLDADAWLGIANLLVWNDVAWHPPEDDDEADEYRYVLACLVRAKELDPNAALPAGVMEELVHLLDQTPEEAVTPQDGPGYLRAKIDRTLGGHWTVSLPGYWYQEFDDGTFQYWFGGRSLFATAYRSDSEDETPDLLAMLKLPPGAATQRADREHLLSVSGFDQHTGNDGEEVLLLSAALSCPGRLLSVTIVCSDPQDRQWALDTWRSISHPA